MENTKNMQKHSINPVLSDSSENQLASMQYQINMIADAVHDIYVCASSNANRLFGNKPQEIVSDANSVGINVPQNTSSTDGASDSGSDLNGELLQMRKSLAILAEHVDTVYAEVFRFTKL